MEVLGLVLFFWVFYGSLAGSYIGTAESRESTGIPLKWEKSTIGWGDFKPRSFCFKCNHLLRIKDLIPIFSYIKNRGRCPYCKEKYSDETFRWECKGALLGLIMVAKFLKDSRNWKGD